MNIIFFGTPDFTIPILYKLYDSQHKIEAIVTSPDKPRGRGKKVSYTPAKEFGLKKNIPVLQTLRLKSAEFCEDLKKYNADVFVVVAFKILAKEIYSIPPKGSFNLHGSILPKYRGAAPIQWALINGDTETGVSTFFLQDKVDTGSIILQKIVQINESDNFETLHDKMSEIGAETVLETIDLIENGNYHLIVQNDSLATAAPKIDKNLCEIDWNSNAESIKNLVRGLTPFPGAFFDHKGKVYKISKCGIAEKIKLKPGEISQTKSEIFIGSNSNAIQILEIKPEGRKAMTAEEFLRGNSLL